MLKYLILSLLIHLLLFSKLQVEEDQSKPGYPEKEKETLSIKVSLPEGTKHEEGKGTVEAPAGKKEDCDNFYYGIGYVVAQYLGADRCVVQSLAEGGPADKAGLQIGDEILEDENGMCPGRGEENTQLTLKLIRNGKTITYTMTRKKICSL